jgi:hypothetical protein
LAEFTTDDSNFWSSHVGPFYDIGGVLAVIGDTEAALDQMVSAGEVLMVLTLDGTKLFPSFQFGPHGELLPSLTMISRLLQPIVDDSWDVALWLTTPISSLDDRSCAEVLLTDDASTVIALAHRDGNILSN